MASVKIDRQKVFEKVTSETIAKVYNPQSFDTDNEQKLRAEYLFTPDDKYWFDKYFDEKAEEISATLKLLNRQEEVGCRVNSIEAEFNVDVDAWESLTSLQTLVESVMIEGVAMMWFRMKNVLELASEYNRLFSLKIAELEQLCASLWNRKRRKPFYN